MEVYIDISKTLIAATIAPCQESRPTEESASFSGLARIANTHVSFDCIIQDVIIVVMIVRLIAGTSLSTDFHDIIHGCDQARHTAGDVSYASSRNMRVVDAYAATVTTARVDRIFNVEPGTV